MIVPKMFEGLPAEGCIPVYRNDCEPLLQGWWMYEVDGSECYPLEEFQSLCNEARAARAGWYG